jgi:predicted PP-loop superfamily ATPase
LHSPGAVAGVDVGSAVAVVIAVAAGVDEATTVTVGRAADMTLQDDKSMLNKMMGAQSLRIRFYLSLQKGNISVTKYLEIHPV